MVPTSPTDTRLDIWIVQRCVAAVYRAAGEITITAVRGAGFALLRYLSFIRIASAARSAPLGRTDSITQAVVQRDLRMRTMEKQYERRLAGLFGRKAQRLTERCSSSES